ncbi:GNAT family N-acetyltransferase [Hyphobacterium sp.]|uniref:GNAT family N-acetyltransferase n=1 Tax=Hyphobacterium sp. TaxID=2004662 RepID=UPI003B52FA75
MTHNDVRHETGDTRGRFVIDLGDGSEAELTYSKAGTSRWIADHTGVPKAHEGQGLGSQLVKALIAAAKAEGVKIVPLCPYIKAWAKKHPEESAIFD